MTYNCNGYTIIFYNDDNNDDGDDKTLADRGIFNIETGWG